MSSFAFGSHDLSKTIGLANANHNILVEIVNEVIGDGSPKGVFDTLQDLEDRYPKGARGIYLVTGTGHWYYWDGEWKDGGIYQATELENGSVTDVKLEISLKEKVNSIPFIKGDVNKLNSDVNRVKNDISTHESSAQAHNAASITYNGNVVGAANAKQAIDKLKSDFNTLVSNAGDGTKDSELVLARAGAPSLGDRLDGFNEQLEDINLNIRNFGAALDDVTDDTQAWIAVHDALPATGGRVLVPFGKTVISQEVIFTKPVVLIGCLIPTLSKTIGSIIRLTGNGSVILLGEGSGVESIHFLGSNTHDNRTKHNNHGIQFRNARPYGKNIMASWCGMDGILIGSDTIKVNVNSFYFTNLRVKDNARHGVHIANPVSGLPDANAGTVTGIDAAGNLGDGLRLTNAHSNTISGLHSENNFGVNSRGLTLIKSAGNMFINPYTEANTIEDILLDADSFENKIFGVRSGVFVNITNLHQSNLIMRMERSKALINYFESELAFKELAISVPGIAGYWSFTQDVTTGSLKLNMKSTSNTRHVDLTTEAGSRRVNVDKLSAGSGTIDGITRTMNSLGTVAGATIAAHSSLERTRAITGVAAGDNVLIVPTDGVLPQGIHPYAYGSAANTVTIRFINYTNADVVLADKSWKLSVIRMG